MEWMSVPRNMGGVHPLSLVNDFKDKYYLNRWIQTHPNSN